MEPEVIYSYTRKQAIEDGELIDVTEWASADRGFLGGFLVPVAVTRGLWNAIEAIPVSQQGVQDVRGRAHDVLWMASLAARRTGVRRTGASDTYRYFELLLAIASTRKRKQLLAIHSGPGDQGEHVITIGFPEDF